MERLGVAYPVKGELVAALKSSRNLRARHFFGWEPRRQGPLANVPELCSKCGNCNDHGRHVCAHCGNGLALLSKYRCLSNTLIYSFFSERLGVRFGGVEYKDAFRWVKQVRPYKAPAELSPGEFIDQCYLVTHIIFTLNNWGELQLPRDLLVHEYLFLRQYLGLHIRRKDVHLIGEFVDALRSLGDSENDPMIQQALGVLMSKQLPDGSWDSIAGRDPYTTYHATMVGIQSLLAHEYRGYGPSFSSLAPMLVNWSRDEDVSWRKERAKAARAAARAAAAEAKAKAEAEAVAEAEAEAATDAEAAEQAEEAEQAEAATEAAAAPATEAQAQEETAGTHEPALGGSVAAEAETGC
mmetsp:Transcript_8633/g.27155  ORF Transcript_8633/g.27155 Transcript_8633/m.27155 type:complete len:353 (+) Transcript_8633:478-1536(+)